MEADIAFTDWVDSVDIAGSNHWLPAYGYQQPMQDTDTNDGVGILVGTQPPFIFLETILEETPDDLRSESDRSGHAGWPDSDSDTESVIHVPRSLGRRDAETPEWSGSERDLAVPKKRRRRADDEEEDDRGESNSLSSRSSSLLQFECLEKHCEDIFHTSATNDPFEGAVHKGDSSNFSFDSLESNRWRLSGSPDSLEDLPEERSDASTSDEDASSDDTMLHSSWSSRGSFRSQNSRIRSYRSFDSLNILQHKQHLSLVELSQSLNNEDFILTQYDAFDKSLVAATADLSKLGEEGDAAMTSETSTGVNEEATTSVQVEQAIAVEAKSQRSAENLSEDSGFGDHIPKLSTLQGRLRDATILEDDDVDDSCSSEYYSSASSSSSSSGDSEDVDDRTIASSKSLKLDAATEFGERRGWAEEESKFISSCWQSAPNLASILYGGGRGEEEEEEEEVVEEKRLGGFLAREAATSVCSGQATATDTAAANGDASIKRHLPDVVDVVVKRDATCDVNAAAFDESRFSTFKMATRLPVVSTPNLNYNSAEFLQNEQTHLSLNRVPLKHFSIDDDELDKEATSKSLTPFPTSAKGVHFCPVVSEVSWRESYSEEDADDGTCEDEEEDVEEEEEEEDEEEEEEDDESEEDEDEEDTGVKIEEIIDDMRIMEITREVAQHVATNTVQHARSGGPDVVAIGNSAVQTATKPPAPVPPTIPVASHVVAAVSGNSAPNRPAPVVNKQSMDEHMVRPVSESAGENNGASATKKPSRFGGFFQRFSFRRRHDVKKKEEKKKTGEGSTSKKPKIAKKPELYGEYEDVTFIPLHEPAPESRPDVVISAKPPLPPQPPRVVGASVKAPAPAPRRILPASPTAAAAQGQSSPTSFDNNARSGSSGSMSDAAMYRPKHRGGYTASSIDPVYPPQHPTGLLETDLDTDITVSAQRPPLPAYQKNAAPKKARSLLNLGMSHGLSLHNPGASAQLKPPTGAGGGKGGHSPRGHHSGAADSRAKSMEFLLDKENQASVQPPENELQKGGAAGERVMSEHQLRVQRSLQKLNVPDWYKNSTVARGHEGFLLRKDAAAAGGQGRETPHQGWPGLGSKTTSLSSLGSTQSAAARSPTSHLLSPSPTPGPHVFTRWSTSRLNSGGTSASTSPCNSTRSSFNYRQPYLGWRSQERLSHPRTPAERLAAGILPQTPVQQQQQVPNLTEVRTSIKEVTSAIVHYVSGARDGSGTLLPDFAAEDSPVNRSPRWDRDHASSPRDQWSNRSASPRGSNGRLCWLESSFVGSRPLETPETPVSLTSDKTNGATDLYLDLNTNNKQQQHFNNAHHVNGPEDRPFEPDSDFDLLRNVDTELRRITAVTEVVRNRPSPGSTTLDDVLDSLLGLPPTSRSPSPGGQSVSGCSPSRPQLPLPQRPHTRRSCGDIRADIAESASDGARPSSAMTERPPYYVSDTLRRRSEGSDPVLRQPAKAAAANGRSARRVSFDVVSQLQAEPLIRCRYSKCSRTASVADARRNFKTCHNCAHVYCSRECRRAHWERHRKTCLHSRVGALCRQVLAAAKEDPATLRHISLLARRGYLAQGRGAVKSFFSSPELAERFVSRGFLDLGEPAYVRWSDLLPNEMGPELYSELIRLCKSYNPDTRLVLYVAVCVVSEVPTSGAVKWERQLVSRCAKLRLCRSLAAVLPQPPAVPVRNRTTPNITRDMENPETLILTSLPGCHGTMSPQRAREISFTNIQRHLRQRGVSLRRHFPDVYKRLCSYVEGSLERFTPVTVYPRDVVSGKNFMCIIMPDAEPEKLEMVPKDSSRVQTIDISIEQENT